MAYVEKYRLAYSDPESNKFWVKIYEDEFAGDLTYLTPSASAVQYNLIDNDENPYLPIQASELIVTFISESNFSLKELFESGSLTDTKYKVEWYSVGDTASLIWVGFLDTESCSEPIEDDPRIVTLRAVDGLGFLKGSGFTDENGDFQYGKYTLLQCIEWCLVKTELELDLHVSVSVFEESMSDRTDNPVNEPFKQCKIHTRSIKEKNCYEVIEAICKAFAATLYQANGVWVIERKHDRWNQIWNDRPIYTTVYEYPYVSDTPTSNEYVFNHTNFTPLAGHQRFFLAPYKDCKTTFRYVVPKDIPRNVNFQEGSFIGPLSSLTNIANTIDHWELVNSIPEVASSATPYRNDELDPVSFKLVESTVRIPRDSPAVANGNRLRSSEVEVNVGDRVAISAETRTKFNFSLTSAYAGMFYVRLAGDSGTTYTLQDDGNSITAKNENCEWVTGTGAVVQFAFSSGNSNEYQSVSCRSAPFPEDGTLYIYLVGWDSSVNSNESWFKNVNISFELFMGATTNLSGQQTQITQDATYRAKEENEITIGDAPKKIISGALFRATDDTELTVGWYLQDGIDLTMRPLIQYTNRALFQLRHRFKTKVEGNIKGAVLQHPADATNTVLQPCVEMEYSATTMTDIKYIPTNVNINSSEGIAQVYLIEFYKDDETADPTGDTETIKYLYE